MPIYIVHTVCKGTIRERWRIVSAKPLDDATIVDVFENDNMREGVAVDFESEQTIGEDDREIVAIEPEDDALAIIAGELDGKTWDADTLDRIAAHVRRAGYPVGEPQ